MLPADTLRCATGRWPVLLPAGVVALLALLLLGAWVMQWDTLLRVHPGYAPTQFNTALGLLLAALALGLQAIERYRIAGWLLLPVAAVGCLSLLQDLSGRDLGIDRLLFEPHLGRELANPGRMSPLSALSLLGIAAAAALLARGNRVADAIASIIVSVLLAVALSALLGYALDHRPLLGWRATTNIAVPTAAALMLLALALQQAIRHSHRLRYREPPVPWWAELLVMAALLASLLLWRGLVLAEEQRQLELQRREAQWLGQRLGRELHAGLLPLRRMAERWRAGDGTSETVWRADARSYLRDLPGLLSLQWLDRDEVVRWVEPQELAPALVGTRPNREPARQALLQRARESGRPALSEPLELLQGGSGLLGFVPVRSNDGHDGFLVGVVRLDALLDSVLADQSLMPPLAVQYEGRSVAFSAEFPRAPAEIDAGRLLRLPLFEGDPRWSLVALLEGRRDERRSALPALVLLAALSLAALLQVAMLLGWSSRQRALSLQATRDRLDDAAERVQLATAAAKVGIWEWRAGSRSLICDGQTWRHLGHAEVPSGATLDHLHAAARDPDMLAELLAALERGDAVVTAVLRVRRPDGSEAELLFDGRRAEETDASGARLTGVCLDITERRRLERLQREFVATVSHELRTPLTAINGALALLDAGQLGELRAPADMLVRNAHQNGQRLAALINDLLDWERLDSGGLRLNLSRQPLRPLLEQSLALHREYANGLQVTLTLAEQTVDASVEVAVDAARIQQVLGNLLSNAVKFSPPGGVVTLGADRLGEQVEVWVQDRGPGIPAAFLPRLFDKFSQADASDTRRRGGTGLGLAISRELVRRMGGSIGVDTREGAGSRFWVRLPLAG